MEQYIGSKIVQAEPAWMVFEKEGEAGKIVVQDHDLELTTAKTVLNGYKVVYEDGYESWSHKEVFEAAYRRTDGLSFGLALEAAKMGKKITRKGWNGKGQYVVLGRNFAYFTSGEMVYDAHHKDIGSKALVFVGTRGSQVGWLASQTDMLADDWTVLDGEVCWTWDNAKEAMKAGAAVRRKGWEDDSWVAILEEPAVLKGKICKVSDEEGYIEPDWEPKGEDLAARDWYIVEV